MALRLVLAMSGLGVVLAMSGLRPVLAMLKPVLAMLRPVPHFGLDPELLLEYDPNFRYSVSFRHVDQCNTLYYLAALTYGTA